MFIFDKDIYQNNPGYYYDIERDFASILSNDYMEAYENIKNEIFGKKNNDTEKRAIFDNLFFNTFYKDKTFDILTIKQKFIDSHA